MNGFANGIMSMLLGWLKVLIGDLWKLMTSPDGDALYKFLSNNWKAILLIVVVIGLAVDAAVYFLRWRPDYIWASRREQRRMKREGGYEAQKREPESEPVKAPEAVYEDEYGYNPYKRPQSDEYNPYAQTSYEPENPREAYKPPVVGTIGGVFAPPAQASRGAARDEMPRGNAVQPIYSARGGMSNEAATARFAPMASTTPYAGETRRYAGLPQENIDPVFDDEPTGYYGFSGAEQRMTNNPAQGMVNSFGNAIPEPAAYLRDMHAGFAPQLTPEQMYPPNEKLTPAADIPRTPTHPGLGADSFRQSFGLTYDGKPADIGRDNFESEPQTAFTPYTDAFDYNRQSGKRSNPFAVIAKKARDLVGDEDDAHKRTIRDLQPAVDIRKAFHEPVYPRGKPYTKGDE